LPDIVELSRMIKPEFNTLKLSVMRPSFL